MTDQPSVEEALTHTESCRRFSVIVAKRQDEFQHVCICGAAVRRDTLREVFSVVAENTTGLSRQRVMSALHRLEEDKK